MDRLRLSLKLASFVLAAMFASTLSIPQARKIDTRPYSKDLNDFLFLEGEFATREPTVDDMSMSVTKEFFKHEELVKSLISCIDIDKPCQYPGMDVLVSQIGISFNPVNDCPECADEIRSIMGYARKQFQREYRRYWKDLVEALSTILPETIG